MASTSRKTLSDLLQDGLDILKTLGDLLQDGLDILKTLGTSAWISRRRHILWWINDQCTGSMDVGSFLHSSSPIGLQEPKESLNKTAPQL